MPPLDNNPTTAPLARQLALWSLLNLTLLPGLAFVMMLWRFRQARQRQDDLALRHGRAGIRINLLAAVALAGVSLALWHISALSEAGRLAAIITYFTLVHSLFILWAVWNWARAGQGHPPWGWG
jgi:hypothetical protein